MLTGKKILIGITGGISAYKICELVRMYKKQNAEVMTVLTPSALNFVTKLTLQTLSQNEVYTDMFDIPNWKPEHIELTKADVFVIAPCSANTLGKMANGIADNLLTSTVLAFKKPIIISPAMNDGMWENNIVQENINKLKNNGITIIEPDEGFLACGTNGKGRLPKLEIIFDKTIEILNNKLKLKGEKILVTAGGTKEKIDPVRFITNNSSGKMGLALADCAYSQGAQVTLVSTFDVKKPYKVIVADTAEKMFNTVKTIDFDTVFMTCAVSDYRAKNISEQKIKKTDENEMTIELVKNPDILKFLAENKKENQTVVGFCAESENLINNAKEKITKKGCDFIVANDISRKDIGFDSNENEVCILDKNLNEFKINKTSKTIVAEKIIEYIYG